MVFQKSITKKIETSNTKRPSTPQITIENPLDKETFVNGIELILEPEFSKKGKLIITINDVAVFDENDSQGFFGYSKFPIPLNKNFKRSNDIKISAWNSIDSNTIAMRVNISISENPEPFQSQAEPLGRDLLNIMVSEPENVFALADYKDTTLTKLLDMQGNSAMILLISAADAITPIVDDRNNEFDDDANSVDGDLATSAVNSGIINGTILQTLGTKITMWYDFGEPLNREIGIKAEFAWNSGLVDPATIQIRVLESSDDIVYTQIHSSTKEIPSGSSIDSLLVDTFETPLTGSRYFRVEFRTVEISSDPSPTATFTTRIHEIYDYHRRTGNAQISFEVLAPETSQWIEYISASDIGAVTFGQGVQKQIGSTIEDDPLTNKFNRFLPSSQTQFRSKMVVTGNIRTAISILKGR